MRIRSGLFLSLLFILTGCNFSSASNIPTMAEMPVATEMVVNLVTTTPLPVSASPSPAFTQTPEQELISNVIGTILPLPDQDFANLRNGPGAVYDQIGKLRANQSVFVLEKNADSTWWKIATNELTGWVYTDYVFISGDTSGVPCISDVSGCKPPLPQENYEKAVSAIRSFTQQPNLQLSFQEISSDPNADMRQVMIFADALGSHYCVDLLKNQVIEYLSQGKAENPGSTKKEVTELRNIAVQIASRTSSIFHQKIGSLHYSEEIGDQTFAFRWEDYGFQGKSNGRPFLQIVLNQKGEIINYINTLDVLEN